MYLTYKIKSQEKLARYDKYEPFGEKSGQLVMYNDVKIDNDGSDVGGTTLQGYYKDEYTFVGMESYQIDFKVFFIFFLPLDSLLYRFVTFVLFSLAISSSS